MESGFKVCVCKNPDAFTHISKKSRDIFVRSHTQSNKFRKEDNTFFGFGTLSRI